MTLLSRERGKLVAFARGARASKRRFGGGLEPFTLVTAELAERGGGDAMARLDSVSVERSFHHIRGDLARIGCAAYAAELAGELVRDHEPHAALFDLLVEYLGRLDAAPARPAELRVFELGRAGGGRVPATARRLRPLRRGGRGRGGRGGVLSSRRGAALRALRGGRRRHHPALGGGGGRAPAVPAERLPGRRGGDDSPRSGGSCARRSGGSWSSSSATGSRPAASSTRWCRTSPTERRGRSGPRVPAGAGRGAYRLTSRGWNHRLHGPGGRLATRREERSRVLPGPHPQAADLLGRPGLHPRPGLRPGGRRRDHEPGHLPARARPGAVERGLRGALPPPGRRPLRREPQPPVPAPPVPGDPQAQPARRPGALPRLARGHRHRPARARHPLRRGRLGVARRWAPGGSAGRSGATGWRSPSTPTSSRPAASR